MEFQRASGVLLHVSSLPSSGGIGDLGPAAHAFISFLAEAKQHVWQVLPLCPTGYGSSPYAGTSAFAGNPYLISLEVLGEWGWLSREQVAKVGGHSSRVNFEDAEHCKLPLLHEGAKNFLQRGQQEWPEQWQAYLDFCQREAFWLEDFALYAVLRLRFKTGAWTDWPEPLRRRVPHALETLAREEAEAIARQKVLQFAFSRQWDELRSAARRHSIRILGDVAIFVNMDSADVWVHPEIFELDGDLKPLRVAGVPPDYFSATGQRWGNPLYRWDVLEGQGFDWWVHRMRRAQQVYDLVRLDHFRGFEAYWAIPAEEETAVQGEWVKAPGWSLFRTLEHALGPLPLIAEDLGLITAEVEELRLLAGFPGMRVIQFGFSDEGAHIHLPHRYEPRMVAYTGTHDNDTTRGWWEQVSAGEREAVFAYLGRRWDREPTASPVWPLICAVEASVAQLAIVPAQDLLELGSDGRMNTPAVPEGNWSWRAPEGAWTAELARKLAALVEVTDRDRDPMVEPGTEL